MKELPTVFTILMMILSFGCAGVDLSKVDTKQATDVIGKIIDQIDKNKQNPTPAPVPAPEPVVTPQPAPVPVPSLTPVPAYLVVVDFDKIADEMRAAGFGPARDTALWYVLFTVYTPREWTVVGDDPDETTLLAQKDAILTWFNSYVEAKYQMFKNNPALKGIILLNDGNDKGGLFIGPKLQAKFQEFIDQGRVDLGVIYRP